MSAPTGMRVFGKLAGPLAGTGLAGIMSPPLLQEGLQTRAFDERTNPPEKLGPEGPPAGVAYSTTGGSPPTITTSAGRRANRPTLTTPGI
jgi:hypothetical protein